MIYYVEDDDSIRELVVYTLRSTGFEAEGYPNGRDFFDAMREKKPELVLLDIMLPDEDGLDILKKIRGRESWRKIPVILLTARGDEYDKVKGLDAGADDYITKPFGVMELVARVRALLRRTQEGTHPGRERTEQPPGAGETRTGILRCAPIEMDIRRHTVNVGEESIALTRKEFELLQFLLENQEMVVSRDSLLESVWGYDFDGETRTVDVHVRTLRQKLGAGGACIETVRGVGYRLNALDADAGPGVERPK